MTESWDDVHVCPACGWPLAPGAGRIDDFVPLVALAPPVSTPEPEAVAEAFVNLVVRPRPDVATLVGLVGSLFALPTVLDVAAEEALRDAVLLRITTTAAHRLPLQLLAIPSPQVKQLSPEDGFLLAQV